MRKMLAKLSLCNSIDRTQPPDPSIYLVHNILQINKSMDRMGIILNSKVVCGLVIRLCLEGPFMHVGVHANDLTLTCTATDILFEPLANTIPHV